MKWSKFLLWGGEKEQGKVRLHIHPLWTTQLQQSLIHLVTKMGTDIYLFTHITPRRLIILWSELLCLECYIYAQVFKFI